MTKISPLSLSIPISIWVLGFVSFLIKISSTIIFSVSPLFATHVLGASMLTIGILEGFVEAITLLTRIFAGLLSDLIHKRKAIIAIGYGFALVSRPLLARASSITDIFIGRALDRVSNGLDAPPRDALVGDLAPPQIKGACYGLRESLSRGGSLVGSLLVIGLLWLTQGNYSLVLWIGCIPTALALIALLIFVKDPIKEKFEHKKVKKKFDLSAIFHLPFVFWLILLLSGIFMISNFSGAFLILRAQQSGVELHLVPLVMVIQNIATSAVAYPVGYISDKIDRRLMMGLGILFIICSNLLLARGETIFIILGGVFLWGSQIGITQSILAVFLADSCPADLRGTGFGLLHFVNGICLITANTLAGWVWAEFGSSFMFYTSATIAAFSALVLPFIHVKPLALRGS